MFDACREGRSAFVGEHDPPVSHSADHVETRGLDLLRGRFAVAFPVALCKPFSVGELSPGEVPEGRVRELVDQGGICGQTARLALGHLATLPS